jgi:hypothetical protein
VSLIRLPAGIKEGRDAADPAVRPQRPQRASTESASPSTAREVTKFVAASVIASLAFVGASVRKEGEGTYRECLFYRKYSSLHDVPPGGGGF